MVEIGPVELLAPEEIVSLVGQQIGLQRERQPQREEQRDQQLEGDDFRPLSCPRSCCDIRHVRRS